MNSPHTHISNSLKSFQLGEFTWKRLVTTKKKHWTNAEHKYYLSLKLEILMNLYSEPS